MINYDGYYLSLTKIKKDSRLKKPSYYLSAYLFSEDGEYKIYTKHDFVDYLLDFTKEDFENKNPIEGEFKIKKNNTLLLIPNSVYGNDIKIEKIDVNKLYNTITKSDMYFVPFSKVDLLYCKKVKTSNIIINELFGSILYDKNILPNDVISKMKSDYQNKKDFLLVRGFLENKFNESINVCNDQYVRAILILLDKNIDNIEKYKVISDPRDIVFLANAKTNNKYDYFNKPL